MKTTFETANDPCGPAAVIAVEVAAASGRLPRAVAFLHVYIVADEPPFHFVNSRRETVVVASLKAGHHKVQFELTDAMHRVISSETVTFTLPPEGRPMEA